MTSETLDAERWPLLTHCYLEVVEVQFPSRLNMGTLFLEDTEQGVDPSAFFSPTCTRSNLGLLSRLRVENWANSDILASLKRAQHWFPPRSVQDRVFGAENSPPTTSQVGIVGRDEKLLLVDQGTVLIEAPHKLCFFRCRIIFPLSSSPAEAPELALVGCITRFYFHLFVKFDESIRQRTKDWDRNTHCDRLPWRLLNLALTLLVEDARRIPDSAASVPACPELDRRPFCVDLLLPREFCWELEAEINDWTWNSLRALSLDRGRVFFVNFLNLCCEPGLQSSVPLSVRLLLAFNLRINQIIDFCRSQDSRLTKVPCVIVLGLSLADYFSGAGGVATSSLPPKLEESLHLAIQTCQQERLPICFVRTLCVELDPSSPPLDAAFDNTALASLQESVDSKRLLPAYDNIPSIRISFALEENLSWLSTDWVPPGRSNAGAAGLLEPSWAEAGSLECDRLDCVIDQIAAATSKPAALTGSNIIEPNDPQSRPIIQLWPLDAAPDIARADAGAEIALRGTTSAEALMNLVGISDRLEEKQRIHLEQVLTALYFSPTQQGGDQKFKVILVAGPLGVGKTLLCYSLRLLRALNVEALVPSEIVESAIGAPQKNLRCFFRRILRRKHSIIVWEDSDMFGENGGRNGAGGTTHEGSVASSIEAEIVSYFCSILDELQTNLDRIQGSLRILLTARICEAGGDRSTDVLDSKLASRVSEVVVLH